jgi:hypothetical protein
VDQDKFGAWFGCRILSKVILFLSYCYCVNARSVINAT